MRPCIELYKSFTCPLLQPPTAPMAVFVLLEVWISLKGEWRCVCKEGGVVCVTQVGTIRMRLLCADNWATLQQVCDLRFWVLCSSMSLELDGWSCILSSVHNCVQSVSGAYCCYTIHCIISNIFLDIWTCWVNAIVSVGAVAYTSSSSRFGRGMDANLTNFYCYGNESHLLNCTYSVSSCSRDYTAGVLCYGDVVPGYFTHFVGHLLY